MVGSNDRDSPKGSSKVAHSAPLSPAVNTNGVSATRTSTETPKLADTAGASSRVEQRLGVLAANLVQLKVWTPKSSCSLPRDRTKTVLLGTS